MDNNFINYSNNENNNFINYSNNCEENFLNNYEINDNNDNVEKNYFDCNESNIDFNNILTELHIVPEKTLDKKILFDVSQYCKQIYKEKIKKPSNKKRKKTSGKINK